MLRNGLYKNVQIIRTNIKFFALQHFLLSIALLLMTCILFDTSNLDQYMVALPLELIVSLIGIIMLTPIFAPEENSDLADLMLSKSFSYFKIIGFRVLYSFVMLVVFIGSFT
ncbi:MAG TPA: hypothetical protein IAA29_03070, partial [Candidatus Paenibacillus intestinavium]|nr:hypothetical protein [Candidatus Paenibacillus intestinavium]